MAQAHDHYETFYAGQGDEDPEGNPLQPDKYYWRLVAKNGETVSVGESYTRERDARRGAVDNAHVSAEAITHEIEEQ